MEQSTIELARIAMVSSATQNRVDKALAEAKRDRVSVTAFLRAYALLMASAGDASAETVLMNEEE